MNRTDWLHVGLAFVGGAGAVIGLIYITLMQIGLV